MAMTQAQLDEIDSARTNRTETIRPTVPALEAMMYTPIPVLDHGFVRVVDYMGDDGAPVQAARISYGRGTRKALDDRNLIRYLLRHQHSTPFEMCEIKYHIKLPIFVARQWVRHRTSSLNEISARYSILDNEFYVPSPDDIATQSTTNRQGRSAAFAADEAAIVIDLLRSDATRSYSMYEHLLNDDGTGNPKDPSRDMLARELARMNLTMNCYTQWYWKVNAHNLMNFLRLRADAHAQKEIRVYADVLMDTMRLWMPATHEAFLDFRMNAVTLSAQMMAVVRGMLEGVNVPTHAEGLSKREMAELVEILRPTRM